MYKLGILGLGFVKLFINEFNEVFVLFELIVLSK